MGVFKKKTKFTMNFGSMPKLARFQCEPNAHFYKGFI